MPHGLVRHSFHHDNKMAWKKYVTFIFYILGITLMFSTEVKLADSSSLTHCKWTVKIRPTLPEEDRYTLDMLADKLAHEIGAINMGQIGELAGYYLYDAVSENASHIIKYLNEHVEWHKRDVFLKRVKRSPPDFNPHYPQFHDPLYRSQWHLKNDKFGHLDCNVTGVWAYNVTGKGVVVAIVDDGVEWRHPDLFDNYCKEGSFDLNSDDDDPTPVYDEKEDNKHGTRCAGEVAAVPNSVCGVGIAYGARFSGIRVLDGPTTDSTEAIAFNKHMDVNDVYSCSWGPEDDGKTVDGPHEMGQAALAHGVVAGRRGFGSIFVVASGNGGEKGDSCNYDGYANSIYTLTIGAIDENGMKPSYAEECDSMLACAVSSGSRSARSIVTTDWSLGKHHAKDQCTNSHTGTSAATPLAAGMIALMLEARPCLTWRDIQHIMAMTAIKIDPSNKWTKNSAGFEHSSIHGFGFLDAWKLVNAAKVWESVPWLTSLVADTYEHKNLEIPMEHNMLTMQVEVLQKDCENHMLSTLEYVVFTVTLSHHMRGKLSYTLECPSGMKSVIPPRHKDASDEGLTDWSFSTLKCWGEEPWGIYKLKIQDKTKILPENKKLGVLKEWKLILYGSPWTKSEMQQRRKLITSSLSGEYLSGLSNFTSDCPPGQVLGFDITTALSDRTIKLVVMLSCFFVFWGVYYSIEMAFCNADDKKAKEQDSEITSNIGMAGHGTYGASSMSVSQPKYDSSTFIGLEDDNTTVLDAEINDTGETNRTQTDPAILQLLYSQDVPMGDVEAANSGAMNEDNIASDGHV